jgi:hypothetical protein
MAAAPIILAAAGSGMQAAGAIQEGNAQYAASQYNIEVNNQNAQEARQQAAEEERRARVMSRKQIGQSRASIGASGIQLEGSPLDVLEESAATAELDALTIRHSGEVKALGFDRDSKLEAFKGKQARQAGYMKAASALISGGTKTAGAMG